MQARSASRWLGAWVGLAVGAAPMAALALPQCAPASPAQISKPGFVVDQLWQRYRNLTPEGRCCSKPCEPIERYNAKVEANAMALDALARDLRLSSAERTKARNDSNAMFGLRGDLGQEFTQCLIDTRVRSTPGGLTCSKPSLSATDLAWYQWCNGFSDRFAQFRALLATKVGTKVGEWRVQSNYFRIKPNGTVDPGSFSIKPYPATSLPPGTNQQPFLNAIGDLQFPAFPAGALQNRMYMQFTASVVRTGPPDAATLDTSPLQQGACPGPTTRP